MGVNAPVWQQLLTCQGLFVLNACDAQAGRAQGERAPPKDRSGGSTQATLGQRQQAAVDNAHAAAGLNSKDIWRQGGPPDGWSPRRAAEWARMFQLSMASVDASWQDAVFAPTVAYLQSARASAHDEFAAMEHRIPRGVQDLMQGGLSSANHSDLEQANKQMSSRFRFVLEPDCHDEMMCDFIAATGGGIGDDILCGALPVEAQQWVLEWFATGGRLGLLYCQRHWAEVLLLAKGMETAASGRADLAEQEEWEASREQELADFQKQLRTWARSS